MGTVVQKIEGVKHVPAHAHEPGAIEHDGEWWRVAQPCACVEDNQGLCHNGCGALLNRDAWEAYAGVGVPHC